MSGDGWTTIESEPGVFFQLIKDFGVSGVQVEELWSLDVESLASLKPVHGLIFLFKWTSEKDTRPIDPNTLGKVFFAKQVINNACATQAILSVLLNAEGLDLGPQLTQFREFTADFPPDMKGLAIGNSDSIRLAHNSFARPEPIIQEEKEATKDDDAFHFISYVQVGGILYEIDESKADAVPLGPVATGQLPLKLAVPLHQVGGTLYELDGLKEGPIPLGPCTEADWLEHVVPHIQERMAKYAEKEVRFNVMAIVHDRLEASEKQIDSLTRVRQAALGRLEGTAAEPMDEDAETSEAITQLPADAEELKGRVQSIEAQLAALHGEVQEEHEKRKKWADENVRRRHNYVPFLFNALRVIAEGRLMGQLIDRTRMLEKEKQAAKQQNK